MNHTILLIVSLALTKTALCNFQSSNQPKIKIQVPASLQPSSPQTSKPANRKLLLDFFTDNSGSAKIADSGSNADSMTKLVKLLNLAKSFEGSNYEVSLAINFKNNNIVAPTVRKLEEVNKKRRI